MCKISIISPVYNMNKYVDECIQSVLAQDFADWEFLLVNDGSTDNTLEILRKYELADKRIKVFDKKNEGQGVARNYVLPYAKGDYVLYLDPDDWLEPKALTKIYNKFQKDNYDVIFFNAYKYYVETMKKNPYLFIECFYSRFKDAVFNAEIASDILFETNGCCFKAYNRKFLVENDIKYSPTKYIEDSEFFVKAILYAQKMSCLNEFIINYRIHNKASCSQVNNNIDAIEKTFYVCEEILLDYYKKFNIQEKALLKSFLKNRIEQLLFHFTRVSFSHKRKYYIMMKKIFLYINQEYKVFSELTNITQVQINFIKNNNWILYLIKYKIHLLKIFISQYFLI